MPKPISCPNDLAYPVGLMFCIHLIHFICLRSPKCLTVGEIPITLLERTPLASQGLCTAW